MTGVRQRFRSATLLAVALCVTLTVSRALGESPREEPWLRGVQPARELGEWGVRGTPSANSPAIARATVAAWTPMAQSPPQLVAPEPVEAQEQLPHAFIPWWQDQVCARLRAGGPPHPIDLDALVVAALAYSPRVRGVSDEVLIQETAIVEAQAAFDTHAFMDSKFFRKSEPIGNILETGGPPRLRDGDWGYRAGLRKRTPMGGSWEISQRIGMRDSNSRFFLPEQQGNSQLALSFNQPLLNGFGKPYNTALIVLADIEASTAMDQTSALLQLHLTQIAESYWELYWQRAVLLQKHRNLRRAEEIWDHLVQRRDVDALESQIVRARAAVATRQAELIRTGANIQNVEAKLRALTNAPELRSSPETELIPLDYPRQVPVEVSLPDATVTALQHRPEIDAASEEIRAASVRLNMSRKELLPALDLVLETYVTGLNQDYDIAQSLVDQFSVGEPSYTAGLVFEVPLQRRAARARLQRRELELRQITQQFEEVVLTLQAEVEVAVREVSATYRELVGKYRAMQAAEAEVAYLTRRWEVLSGDERSASFLLEDLLNAQDRLALEEYGFAAAQRDYTLSQILLKRATGTLLQYECIEPVRTCRGGQPELQFQRTARIVTPDEVLPPISTTGRASAGRTTLR